MAQAILVTSDLTPEMIATGRTLVTGLDGQGLIFDAAFWLLNEESSEWRLVLANRSVRKDGSRDLYNKVNRILARLRLQDAIWIGIVSIVDLRVPIVQSLRAALGTAGSVDGARLDNATIDGVRIPPCLIYRLSARQKLASHAGGPLTAGHHLA